MNLEILNPYTIKIALAARKYDSIRAISKRIGLSYGWTYKWLLEMEKLGVFRRSGKRVFLDDRNVFYKTILNFVRSAFEKNVAFHYNILNLFGIKYCFTGIDAVFIWTDGGYNIARYKGYYPMFIKVRKSDKELFGFYTNKIGLNKKIFYKPVFLEDFPVSFYNGTPVDSLEETIKFMEKYVYNFEPALEMIQEIHGKKTGIEYKEVVTNV